MGNGASLTERPARGEGEAWRDYWARVQPRTWFERWGYWRTEQEIDAGRRAYLVKRLGVQPDIARGIYPFRDEHSPIPLTRADVEWLLATHESGGTRGPVDWDDAKQRAREGIDVRGADLSTVDLTALPLARVQGGLIGAEWLNAAPDRRDLAGVLLQRANLRAAWLQGAILRRSCLEDATFYMAHLEHADLRRARMEGTDLGEAYLGGASIRGGYLNNLSRFDRVRLAARDRVGPSVADVQWDGVNLAVVDWRAPRMLGDEREARARENALGEDKNGKTRLQDFADAVRANRQLAVALSGQGLREDADHFAERAQVLQRQVLRRQRKWVAWLFSLGLAAMAGYGYRPRRIVGWYLALLVLSSLVYAWQGYIKIHACPAVCAPVVFGNAVLSNPGTLGEACVQAITALHGRGFFPQPNATGWEMATAAFDAVSGLVIEATFVATFIQRYFAR